MDYRSIEDRLRALERQLGQFPVRQPVSGPSNGFAALIVAAARDGSNWRWVYTIRAAEKTADGYDGWSNTADSTDLTAYNFAEDLNGASGLLGNGVDTANLPDPPATFAPQPIPVGSPVWVVSVSAPAGTEYWIVQYPTSIDGACS
jgi:hypothetical protein